MLAAIRKRFTIANLTMTLALVFAMSGGAYAAKKYLITSTKQISPKVIAALKGKTGPQGPAGLTGPQGAPGPAGASGPKGETGPAGLKGETGPAGTNVTAKTLATSNTACNKLGGSEFKAGNSTPTFACNGQEGKEGKEGAQGATGKEGPQGPEGSPWTAGGTLPAGKTETGTWAIQTADNNKGEFKLLAIPFPIPLREATSSLEFIKFGTKGTEQCNGTVEKPTAAVGTLCVYEGESLPRELGFVKNGAGFANAFFENPAGSGVGPTGSVIYFETNEPASKNANEEVSAEGTWAVTGN